MTSESFLNDSWWIIIVAHASGWVHTLLVDLKWKKKKIIKMSDQTKIDIDRIDDESIPYIYICVS